MTEGEALARQIEAECHDLAALERELYGEIPPTVEELVAIICDGWEREEMSCAS